MEMEMGHVEPTGGFVLVTILFLAVVAGLIAPRLTIAQAALAWGAAILATAVAGYWAYRGQAVAYSIDMLLYPAISAGAVAASLWLGRVLGRRERFRGPAYRILASIAAYVVIVVVAVSLGMWWIERTLVSSLDSAP